MRKANITSNFDIRNSQSLIQSWSGNILKATGGSRLSNGNRNLTFNLDLENANLFQLLKIDVDDFSSLHVKGELDEQNQVLALETTLGNFNGYDVTLDTLSTTLAAFRDSVNISMMATNLLYNSIEFGDLNFNVLTKGDTARSNFTVKRDSVATLDLSVRILSIDSGVFHLS